MYVPSTSIVFGTPFRASPLFSEHRVSDSPLFSKYPGGSPINHRAIIKGQVNLLLLLSLYNVYQAPHPTMSKLYDAIVIGGSAAGLSATLTLSRALASVVCIDAGQPCNRYAKVSHNFLTHDGDSPLVIRDSARAQVERYEKTSFVNDVVKTLSREEDGTFTVTTTLNGQLMGKNIILAAGLNDNIDSVPIKNLSQFWGNSIFTCPYCHGFEYAGKRAGLLIPNAMFLKMMIPTIYNWNKDLTIFSTYETFQVIGLDELEKRGIKAVDSEIVQVNGDPPSRLKSVTLKTGDVLELDVLYYMPPSVINLKDEIVKLGVGLDSLGLIKTEQPSQATSVKGVYAAGDCQSMLRSLASSTNSGQLAGASIGHSLYVENYAKAGDVKLNYLL